MYISNKMWCNCTFVGSCHRIPYTILNVYTFLSVSHSHKYHVVSNSQITRYFTRCQASNVALSLLFMNAVCACSVWSQLSNELCTCACTSVQEQAPNSVPVPLQTLVHALHDSQRSVRISVFHLEHSSLPWAMLRYYLLNANTDRRTCIYSRVTNYQTQGENPTYSHTQFTFVRLLHHNTPFICSYVFAIICSNYKRAQYEEIKLKKQLRC